MKIGELTALHIGRTITLAGQPRVIDSLRHFTINDQKGNVVARHTTLLLRPTGSKDARHLGEHQADSSDTVVLAN